jgi:hypothetical protein
MSSGTAILCLFSLSSASTKNVLRPTSTSRSLYRSDALTFRKRSRITHYVSVGRLLSSRCLPWMRWSRSLMPEGSRVRLDSGLFSCCFSCWSFRLLRLEKLINIIDGRTQFRLLIQSTEILANSSSSIR